MKPGNPRKGGREGGREGWREGGREGGRERGREGGGSERASVGRGRVGRWVGGCYGEREA